MAANSGLYTLADLEQLAAGGSHYTSRNLFGDDTSNDAPLAPVHIRTRILNVVRNATGAVSRADIAKALQVKKTPWLITSIEGLVLDGFLARKHTIRSNGVIMYWYEVAP